MENNVELSTSMLVPLRMISPNYRSGDSSGHHQLAVMAPSSATAPAFTRSRFHLPGDWRVQKVFRSDGNQFDKYYHEPGTRRKFRSLKSVERYITGEEYAPSSGGVKLSNYVRGSSSRKWIASGGMLLRLENESEQCQLALMGPTTRTATSSFSLPDGWIVEEVPRRRDSTVDKYYYEPGTGRRFRSLVSVERYLAEEGDYNAPLSQLFKLKNRVKNSGSVNKAKTSTSNFAEPPAKINWVLADSGGSKWNPFLGESMVPAPVKQQWATKFNLAFKESNCAAPNFEC